MAYVNTLQDRYNRAQNFIARWAGHLSDCAGSTNGSVCMCGFYEAVRDLNKFCIEKDKIVAPPAKQHKVHA